jgi:hypothetical protein
MKKAWQLPIKYCNWLKIVDPNQFIGRTAEQLRSFWNFSIYLYQEFQEQIQHRESFPDRHELLVPV